MPPSNRHSNKSFCAYFICYLTFVLFHLPKAMAAANDRISRDSLTQSLAYDATTNEGEIFTKQNIVSALRSQRDLAINVSINRIQWPAISLSSSFFGNNYTDSKLQGLSSVMGSGYRRLVLDLYWRSDLGNWQLCPEIIPDTTSTQRMLLNPNLLGGLNSPNRTVTRPLPTISTTSSNATQSTTSYRPLIAKDLNFREAVFSREDVVISSYTCTPWITFRHFMQALDGYLGSIEPIRNPENTDVYILILNLNNLNVTTNNNIQSVNTNSTWLDSMSANQSLSLQQTIQSSVGQSLASTSKIYKPPNLTQDRANLTVSFNTTGMPYFTTEDNPNTQTLTTQTGWPPWSYLIENRFQLLVGFGNNNLPTNTNYNTTDDAQLIFNEVDLGGGSMNVVNVTSMEATGWTNCSVPGSNNYMIPSGNETTDLVGGIPPGGNAVSWSWAYMVDQGNPFSYQSANNASACGYSPYFTASSYAANSYPVALNASSSIGNPILSTIWSWDVGQPPYLMGSLRNGSNLLCASVQVSNGRWKAADCAALYKVACRSVQDPDWALTSDYYSYDRAASSCPDKFKFEAPRTAQQNHMLFMIVQNATRSVATATIQSTADQFVWIDLNNAGGQDCWVVGKNSTCWWTNGSNGEFTGLIQTSAVAGVIILIFVSLFIWVKCTRMYRQRKAGIRKGIVSRLIQEREYVTVPA
ncbi:hypothetical protein K450DRAFT_230664 [Umbelopsis ramanniana AG]|uniref:Maintenance of telomere capping protein 6 n=1 Tax=Umbelopsis ramanniana AG TaxID=1314678 RepID=A0AAD5EDF1_UMBRA|nr:uncharacterized protein K450DRAFT_230664 [Umbelopsis ramanniana AG]KAI8581678.1 hypothetical protein K450DRAFT_230664 [Umbelopsis ramanniana AG]